MKVFKAKIITEHKGEKTCFIRAKDKLNAQYQLLSQGFSILELNELEKRTFFQVKISEEKLAYLFKQFSLLLHIGLSMGQSFALLEKSLLDKALKNLVSSLALKLASGQSLSSVLQDERLSLNQSELALVKMGENTGDLSLAFSHIATLKEQGLENTKRLKKALRYPLIVLFSLLLAFVLLILFIVPEFMRIFEDFSLTLPLITRILLGLYAFLSTYLVFLVFLVLSFIFAFYFAYKKNEKFSFAVDSFVCHIPIFKNLIFYMQNYHFFFIFSLLLRSGVNVSSALELASLGVKNKFLAFKYTKIKDFVKQGLSLDEAFKKVGIFEGLVLTLLSVAMKSAKIDELSQKIALYYKDKLDTYTDRLLSLLEPFMTFVVALLVLFLALGIFLPMWELNSIASF